MQPPEPPAVPQHRCQTRAATALIWEHIEDEPGAALPESARDHPPARSCPTWSMERWMWISAASGCAPRPAPAEDPTYGIIGMFHLLPPALAWLWRLVAPRGHANPSIVDTEGMTSEGVGSYWPFATGRRVDQANLLLEADHRNPRGPLRPHPPTSTSAAGRSGSCRSGSCASTWPGAAGPRSPPSR